MIKIYRTSIDGCRSVRSFKSLKGARKFATDAVGPQDAFGGHYAVSNDGIVKVTWAGCTRAELFATPKSDTSHLVQEHQFYTRGNTMFCRQAGYTYDQVNQQIGTVMETMDPYVGDTPTGWGVFHNKGETPIIFSEEARFATREAALAHAKAAFLAWLDYLRTPEEYA
jgi:hypothetical protein